MTDLEVFQDLVLTGPEAGRGIFAAALREAPPPWHYSAKRSLEIERNAIGDRGILVFERDAIEGSAAVGLSLWPQEGGYYVPNVNLVDGGQLTVGEYNGVLSNFAESVVKPIASRFGFAASMTPATQNLDNWLGPEAAIALRQFSGAADKSTRAAHPMDQQRWFDFIIITHRSGPRIAPDHLARWLHQIEGWDERSAHDLAGSFERGIGLLDREVETR